VDQFGRQDCTGGTDWMAMSHDAAFDIDGVLGEAKFASDNYGNRRERFIDLKAARRFGSAPVSTELSMNAIEDASTQAARTTRRRGAGISRPNSRGHGSALIMPTPHWSQNGCIMLVSTTAILRRPGGYLPS
jgi:hypothetical protein